MVLSERSFAEAIADISDDSSYTDVFDEDAATVEQDFADAIASISMDDGLNL